MAQPVQFRITIEDRALQSLLNRAAKMGTPTVLMQRIAGKLESLTQQAFIDQGPGWPQLSATTIKLRTKHNQWPGRMLDVSPAGLKNSVQSGNTSHSAWVGAGSGKSKDYAMMQQFGGTTGAGSWIPGKIIKPRPYIPMTPAKELTPEAQRSVERLAMEYLEQLR